MELAGARTAVPAAGAVAQRLNGLADVLLTAMRPRDPRVAARTVSALCAIGVLVTLITLPMGANAGVVIDGWAIALAGFALLLAVLVSAAARYFDEASSVAWALCPFAAILSIVLVDVATHDGSVGAQVFFFFPAVYGAALLPRLGAVLVTGASLAGELVVVLTQLPPREAAVNACYMAAVLVTTAVVLVRSMERQQKLLDDLARLATVDPLTGLVTRRAFDEAVSTTLAYPEGDEGTSLAVIDVDEFKSVNDRHGHPAGDLVLVQLSELLVRASRRGDVVSRMGGDEIAMLLPRCTVGTAQRRAEEIVDQVRRDGFQLWGGEVLRVSISVGLAHAPTHGHDPRSLYAAADAALYEAKRAGRDRVAVRGVGGVAPGAVVARATPT